MESGFFTNKKEIIRLNNRLPDGEKIDAFLSLFLVKQAIFL